MPPVPAPQPEAKIGAIGRIIGVFFSPSETFPDIARKPTWIAPLILMIIVACALQITLARKVDWLAATKRGIERVPMAARQFEQLPEERRQQAFAEQAASAERSRYYRGIWGPVVFVGFLTLIYWGAYNLLGGVGTNFKTSFGLTAHALLPIIVKELLGIPVVLMREADSIDPDNFLASNLTAFLPNDAKLWQWALGASFDLFSIWTLILIAMAFSSINPKKLSFGKAVGIGVLVWFVFVVFGVGIAMIFS
jgi:hypothetical protein